MLRADTGVDEVEAKEEGELDEDSCLRLVLLREVCWRSAGCCTKSGESSREAGIAS